MARIDLSQLPLCVEDCRLAWLDADPGPATPDAYADLLRRLEQSAGRFPPLYRTLATEPFLARVRRLGARGFREILRKDPDREGRAGLLTDIAQAILQNGEGYQQKATDAFQEVISDLYDGYLSAADREGIKEPDYEQIAPLVKWGNPAFGPYTWPVDATRSFGLEVAIVNLPPANARRGLFAYAALAHEVGGHDILHADDGLLDELARRTSSALVAAKLGAPLAEYWASRIDEAASDVLGILNLGPAAAIGMLAYFRGLNAASELEAKLSSDGGEGDPHPADICRGWLAAESVRLLDFGAAAAWADAIGAETDRDAGSIRLAGRRTTLAHAKASAAIVARTVTTERLDALDGHAFGEVQNWRARDASIAAKVEKLLRGPGQLPAQLAAGTYAAHVVAAAVMAALRDAATITAVFDRMQDVLKTMHDANPSWGPLFVAHPGDLVPGAALAMRSPRSAPA